MTTPRISNADEPEGGPFGSPRASDESQVGARIPAEEFEKITKYVLTKNAELYRRLAARDFEPHPSDDFSWRERLPTPEGASRAPGADGTTRR